MYSTARSVKIQHTDMVSDTRTSTGFINRKLPRVTTATPAFCFWIAVTSTQIISAICTASSRSDGIVKPCARELQRYRKLLGAENIALLCDIQTKHTFMLSSAISIEESALMATECGADALIITGAHTGSASPLETIRRVREVTKLPLIAGSGVNAQNAADQLSLVEAAIVGSAMKPHGKAEEPIDEALAAKLMQSVKACR